MKQNWRESWWFNFLVWMARSRKFKLTILALVGAVLAFQAGDLPLDQLVDKAFDLVIILILAIAGEDIGNRIAESIK